MGGGVMPERDRPQLTPRQLQVLERLVLGESDKQIGAALGLTTKAVSDRLARLYRALALGDLGSPRVAAATWYLTVGRAQHDKEAD